jgi:hypothetical protein
MSREDELYEKSLDFAKEQTEEEGLGWIQPSGNDSGIERYDGTEYAVLRDSGGKVMGVIRIDDPEADEFTILDPEDYPEELEKEIGEDGESEEP